MPFRLIMSEKMDTTPTIDMVIAEFETAISEGMAMMAGPSGGLVK